MKKNIFYTVLFGLVMEFEINILLKHSIGGMVGVLVLYSCIGILTYYTFPRVMNWSKVRSKGFWWALFTHGFAGLFIIEWGFMGNTFFHIPQLLLATIAQLGMFAWWATIAAMPYLLRQPESLPLRKSILFIYTLYAVVSLPLALMFGLGPIIFLEPPVYLFFFRYYKKFATMLDNSSI